MDSKEEEGLVTGFNAILNGRLDGVCSSNLKVCPVNLCLFLFIYQSINVVLSSHTYIHIYQYSLLCFGSACLKIVLRVSKGKHTCYSSDFVNV